MGSLKQAIDQPNVKVDYLTTVPYRETEHKADKSVAVEVIGFITGGMVIQFGNILKLSVEFKSNSVIYTEKTAGNPSHREPADSITSIDKTNRNYVSVVGDVENVEKQTALQSHV